MSDTVVTSNPVIQTIELPPYHRLDVDNAHIIFQTLSAGDQDIPLIVGNNTNIQTVVITQPTTAVAKDETVTLVSEGLQGPSGQGVPAGGSTGQVLSKNSSASFDTAWAAINLQTQVSGNLPFANIADIASQTILGRQSSGLGDIEVLTPTQIRSLVGFQHGLNTAGETSINQSINASSTFTQNIPLSGSSWTHGMLMVRDSNAGVNCGALIIFSTEINKAAGLCGNPIYLSTGSWVAGSRVRLAIFDNFLTDTIFSGGAASYEMRIDSARINGSNLEVVWRNVTFFNRTLIARMRWFVWRGDQVNA